MNTITHALLPVIAAGVSERADLGPESRRGSLTTRDFLFIGLAGAAPDLLDPHLSLADRYSSWTHNLAAWAGFSLLIVAVLLWQRQGFSLRLAAWLSGAYLLHLFCDAIAGGIAWLSPFAADSIIGSYLVSPALWLPLDVACLLATYLRFRAVPRLRKAWEHRRTSEF